MNDEPKKPADGAEIPTANNKTPAPEAKGPAPADALVSGVHKSVEGVTDTVEFCGRLVPRDIAQAWETFLGTRHIKTTGVQYMLEQRGSNNEQALVLEGDVSLHDPLSLPPNIRIRGDLNILLPTEKVFSEGLVVDGDVRVDSICSFEFPKNFNIGGKLYLNRRFGPINIAFCLQYFEILKALVQEGKVKGGVYLNGFEITPNATLEDVISKQVKQKAVPGRRAGGRPPYYPAAEYLLKHPDDFRHLKNFDELLAFAKKVHRSERRLA